MLTSASRVVRLASRRVGAESRPVLANLASIPFTVAGMGCLAAAAFQVSVAVGLVSTGVLLVVLEHLIADER